MLTGCAVAVHIIVVCNVVDSALYSSISRHPSVEQLKRVLDSIEKAT